MIEHHPLRGATVPLLHLLTARRIERRQHREAVAKAKFLVQKFIEVLSQLQRQEGNYVLSMDLYAAFERFCGIDLPDRFQIEFGRQISKACRSGQLPFQRTIHGKASLAAYDGIDPAELESAIAKAGAPAA